jgi:formylglycine-generating enzyme required for sulfatase activity
MTCPLLFVVVARVIAQDPAPSAAPPAASAFAPCETPPDGMACVPGGPAIVGSDDGPMNERPKRTIELSTFYMDQHEITHAQYQRCVEAGACPKLMLGPYNQNIMKPFVGPDQPAVPVDYERAVKVCTFYGKRLPTEWEWEKAARGPSGEIYPWGNDEPSCDKAVFRECAPKGCKPYPGHKYEWDCVEHATKNVGSFPAGHYGIFDMAGNGYEWTSTWAGDSAKAPCKECAGKDPTGICSSTDPCSRGGNRKILRGGSWYWPKDQVRGSYRRAELLVTKTHRLSARCASTTAVLAGFPAKLGTEKRALPAAPTPPSAEERRIAHAVPDDKLDKQECENKGRSFMDCRDPSSYIKTNEPRQHVFRKYIENLGGGFTGVGIDQNYTLMAVQRAQWGWLFDYDPTVVRLHRALKAIILDSADRAAFLAHFDEKNKAQSLAAIDKTWADHPERAAVREVYSVTRKNLAPYYAKQLKGVPEDPTWGWLATEESFQFIRTLYQQDRIVIVKGDMLASQAMQGIAKAARELKVPMRVYYPSNAPEFWPHSKQYKENVIALPFDQDSVILQTLSGLAPGFGEKKKGYWHYNVQAGRMQQELMRRREVGSMRQLVGVRNKTDDPDLTLSGLERAR